MKEKYAVYFDNTNGDPIRIVVEADDEGDAMLKAIDIMNDRLNRIFDSMGGGINGYLSISKIVCLKDDCRSLNCKPKVKCNNRPPRRKVKDDVKFKGHLGTWYLLDWMDDFELYEHEQYGDTIDHLLARKGKVLTSEIPIDFTIGDAIDFYYEYCAKSDNRKPKKKSVKKKPVKKKSPAKSKPKLNAKKVRK